MLFLRKSIYYQISILVFTVVTFTGLFSVYAQDSSTDILSISISRVHDQLQGHWGEITISIDSGSAMLNKIDSFEFLVGFDNNALTAVKVLPGSLIDSGEFEYFFSEIVYPEDCDSTCPSAFIRISGKRDIDNGVENKYKISRPGELIKLKYLFTNNYNYQCHYVPVRFCWLNCDDNSILDKSGRPICSKTEAFDYCDYKIAENNNLKYIRPPTGCNDAAAKQNARLVFRNGFVKDICMDIDDRGDVNLNGIPNEMADIEMFIDYLLNGASTLKVNYEGQISATETNGDGIKATIRDLVYIIRDYEHRIDHRHCPLPKPEKIIFGDLHLTDTDSSIIINSNCSDSLGGMYMTLYAPGLQKDDNFQVKTFADIQNMNIRYNFHYDTLKILIFQFSDNQNSATIKQGGNSIVEIISSGIRPELTHASAAGYLAEPVKLKID
jgi:hypothetical protein